MFHMRCQQPVKIACGSGGIRTHASEETGALNQRLRPLGHATGTSLVSEKPESGLCVEFGVQFLGHRSTFEWNEDV